VTFAESAAHPWVLESSMDGRDFAVLYEGAPDADTMFAVVDVPRIVARYVRISFPDKPLDVEEIRVH